MPGVTPRQVYSALTSAGFSTVQAIGVMANGIAESGLNPEARAMDTNGYYSDGIWQFNEKSYPNAHSLVTGHPAADLTSQVGFLKSVVSGQALNGSTPQQVASNFAAYFERCQGCQPGGTQNNERQADATDVAQWASSGDWPTSAGSGIGSSSSSGSSGSSGSSSDCVIGFNGVLGLGKACLLSKSELRGIIGAWVIIGAGAIGLVGAVILAAAAFRKTGAARVVADTISIVPGGKGAATVIRRAA